MKGMEKIRVLLVDDHEMVRMGLATYLNTEPDIEVIGEANNGREGVEQAVSLKPDVVLMDLVMEVMDGIEATRELKKQWPECKVIVLTSFIEKEKVFPVIEAGAFSYLLKTSRAPEIAQAIRQAAEGNPTIEGKVASMMMNRMQTKPAKHESLTKREMDVLALIGKGFSNKEIGEHRLFSARGKVPEPLRLAGRKVPGILYELNRREIVLPCPDALDRDAGKNRLTVSRLRLNL